GVMNPKPLASLNHFTFPVVRMSQLLRELIVEGAGTHRTLTMPVARDDTMSRGVMMPRPESRTEELRLQATAKVVGQENAVKAENCMYLSFSYRRAGN